MNKPRLYHTLRARFETSKDLVQKGKTAEASDLNQLNINETLIEILAALEEISDTLKAPAAEPKPVKLAANPKSGKS